MLVTIKLKSYGSACSETNNFSSFEIFPPTVWHIRWDWEIYICIYVYTHNVHIYIYIRRLLSTRACSFCFPTMRARNWIWHGAELAGGRCCRHVGSRPCGVISLLIFGKSADFDFVGSQGGPPAALPPPFAPRHRPPLPISISLAAHPPRLPTRLSSAASACALDRHATAFSSALRLLTTPPPALRFISIQSIHPSVDWLYQINLLLIDAIGFQNLTVLSLLSLLAACHFPFADSPTRQVCSALLGVRLSFPLSEDAIVLSWSEHKSAS
jgi:hypothetical protein